MKKDYSKLPWMEINKFLLEVERLRQSKDLFAETVKHIEQIIAYDQARIYFINDSSKIIDEILFGVDKWWSRIYVDYYSKSKRYSIKNSTNRQGSHKALYNWNDFEEDDFIRDYIRPQGIKSSLAFIFYNEDSSINCICMLDRTGKISFSETETEIVNIIQPHVQNLSMNLVKNINDIQHSKANNSIFDLLTNREQEIVDYLSRGQAPSTISDELYISKNTVYRHIANIYSKLQVSNRQELIVKILGVNNF
ncbi:response regulator transcription factor [Alkalibacter mobilis]|uniref:response regulator transcription factor n=1 Tax=Alkalibacter mobilis TaxID=2787712 RepID=UPI0018A0CCEB|nr:helix-turn-helix transcriptional regulator [Alkalibacter mobilis]MBF7096826.1 hypothetical protein [Alkalibacter mobilis]